MTFGRVAIAGITLVCLSGCGSTIEDVMGTSKLAPDERQVRVHQVLALPPDHDLRPPMEGPTTNSGDLTLDAGTGTFVDTGATETTAPAAQPTTTARAAVETPDDGTGPRSITPDTPAAQASSSGHVISDTNPDGTPKTYRQKVDEAQQRRRELERQRNPNYGTIFNVGDFIWGD